MSALTDIVAALRPLVTLASGDRVFPVVIPEEIDFDDGPAIQFEVIGRPTTENGTQSLCGGLDGLGLVPMHVRILIAGRDYATLWALCDQALSALLAVQGVRVDMAGRDLDFNFEHRCFAVEILATCERAIGA